MENNVPNSFEYQDEDIIDWQNEANAIIRDVKDHVQGIKISENLVSNTFEIFLNVETLEREKYCIRVSGSGFQVSGRDFDKTNELTDNPDDIYETPYALLTKLSQGYIQSFAEKLSQQIARSLS